MPNLKNLRHFICFSLFLLTFSVLQSCSTKETHENIQRSGNRKVGLMIQKISVGDQASENPDFRMYFNDLMTRTVKDVYGSDVQLMNITSGELLESPDSLFLLASNEIDDLFLADISLPSDFVVPTDAETTSTLSPEEAAVVNQGKRIEVNTRVLNGANLRTVTILKSSVGSGPKAEFEKEFAARFKENALEVFPNPNVYPSSDPLHFANLLFQYSEKRERENLALLNCENAQEILSGYAQARDLYQKAKTKETNDSVGQQARLHEINTKLDESTRKSDVLKKCQEDNIKGFSIESEFLGIDATNQGLIKQAMQKARVDELLKQYTSKPVLFSYAVESTGDISLQVFLRFDRNKFLGWNKKQGTPGVFQNFNILSLEPYYPILQTLVYLRHSLPKEAPQSLQIPFVKMGMNLVLQTLLNGEIFVGANGRVSKEANAIELFYPSSLIVKIPSYETATVTTRSEDIFQEKGWLALSSCKTMDGTVTEDGLVMQFFGLPCKL